MFAIRAFVFLLFISASHVGSQLNIPPGNKDLSAITTTCAYYDYQDWVSEHSSQGGRSRQKSRNDRRKPQFRHVSNMRSTSLSGNRRTSTGRNPPSRPRASMITACPRDMLNHRSDSQVYPDACVDALTTGPLNNPDTENKLKAGYNIIDNCGKLIDISMNDGSSTTFQIVGFCRFTASTRNSATNDFCHYLGIDYTQLSRRANPNTWSSVGL
ncbi:hypothetical protein DFH28DRAFT_970281, partial [Melampsora americana]